MMDTGIVIEGFSWFWPISAAVLAAIIAISISAVHFIREGVSSFAKSRLVLLPLMLSALIMFPVFVLTFGVSITMYSSNAVEEVQQAYDVVLIDEDGGQDIAGLRLPGYENISFRHDNELFEDARLDKTELSDGSMHFVLMFDSAGRETMEEFSPDLLEEANNDSLTELSTND